MQVVVVPMLFRRPCTSPLWTRLSCMVTCLLLLLAMKPFRLLARQVKRLGKRHLKSPVPLPHRPQQLQLQAQKVAVSSAYWLFKCRSRTSRPPTRRQPLALLLQKPIRRYLLLLSP